MASDVVRCSLCDNQMPANTEACFVCGTPNPFYALYSNAAQDESGASPAASDGGATDQGVPVLAAPTSTSSLSPDDTSGEFDLSALFAQPQSQPEETNAEAPEPAPGLDLASIFSWGEDPSPTLVQEEPPVVSETDAPPPDVLLPDDGIDTNQSPDSRAAHEAVGPLDVPIEATSTPPEEETSDVETSVRADINAPTEAVAVQSTSEAAEAISEGPVFSGEQDVPSMEKGDAAAVEQDDISVAASEELSYVGLPAEDPVVAEPEPDPVSPEPYNIQAAEETEQAVEEPSFTSQEESEPDIYASDAAHDIEPAGVVTDIPIAESDVGPESQPQADALSEDALREAAEQEVTAYVPEIVEQPSLEVSQDEATFSGGEVSSPDETLQLEEYLAALETEPELGDGVAGDEAFVAESAGEYVGDEVQAVPVPDITTSVEPDVESVPGEEKTSQFTYAEADGGALSIVDPEDMEPQAVASTGPIAIGQVEPEQTSEVVEQVDAADTIDASATAPLPPDSAPAAETVAVEEQVTPEADLADTFSQPPVEAEPLSAEQLVSSPVADETVPNDFVGAEPEIAPLGAGAEPIQAAPDIVATSVQAQPVQDAPPQSQDIVPVVHTTGSSSNPQAQAPTLHTSGSPRWAPPPPPPPPTPYGGLPIRVEPDLWPAYVPPAQQEVSTDAATVSVEPLPTPEEASEVTPTLIEPPVELSPVQTQHQPITQPIEAEPQAQVASQPQPEEAQPQPQIEIEAQPQPQPQVVQPELLTTGPATVDTAPLQIDTEGAQPAQAAGEVLDLSTLFEQIEIDTSERPIPRPTIVTSEPPPAEASPEGAVPTEAPTQSETSASPRRQTIMPVTITPSPGTQAPVSSVYQPGPNSSYDASAWQAFATGKGSASNQASTPSQQSPAQQEPVKWSEFAQSGAPDPYTVGVGPSEQPDPNAWQPTPGMPRPQRGTPEYDAMVRAALAQRGIAYNPSTPGATPTPTSSQASTSAPQPQPTIQPQPDQPRPKPGTPEYDAMVKAALAQRGISTGPLSSQRTETTPSYQTPQQPQTQSAWQPEPGQPRPKPGTPEYDAMVKAALAQRGISTNPPPSQPSSQGSQTSSFDPSRPRPKPGTPEYDEMVRAALNERRQREGR